MFAQTKRSSSMQRVITEDTIKLGEVKKLQSQKTKMVVFVLTRQNIGESFWKINKIKSTSRNAAAAIENLVNLIQS